MNLFKKVCSIFYNLRDFMLFGDYKTKISFLIFGFGNIANKQYFRGFLYLIYEIVFLAYMILFGGKFLGDFGTLGTIETYETENGFKVIGDNSFNILLFGVATILILFCTVFAWYSSIKQAYSVQKLKSINACLSTGRQDIKELGNKYYHATLLSLPMLGLIVFTIIPLIFMIFVSFTNYNNLHMPPEKLFTWVGFENFSTLLTGNGLSGGNAVKFSYTFWNILLWTLTWAILATFTNFFIGMAVAIVINKKGIHLKKVWRTVLVTTIAVPQFISLLLMSKMLSTDGVFNLILSWMGVGPISWLLHPTLAKVTVVLVNLWVGVPYTVLSCTGILMNVPSDLYEAAKIDGANPYKMFASITLPYMMFVLGPSLITTFVGNINNFNIIFLTTGGGPNFDPNMVSSAGQSDLLITWLYKLTVNNQTYDMASVIGILVFIVVATISLIFYGRSSSVKNEEDFQ
ncbi:MAG TPA: sugar ABC transporter permease [Candidatus Onthovivens sp.]|nr:sugar ABC transporter permease [Candidatus Onthovivens sp.]